MIERRKYRSSYSFLTDTLVASRIAAAGRAGGAVRAVASTHKGTRASEALHTGGDGRTRLSGSVTIFPLGFGSCCLGTSRAKGMVIGLSTRARRADRPISSRDMTGTVHAPPQKMPRLRECLSYARLYFSTTSLTRPVPLVMHPR